MAKKPLVIVAHPNLKNSRLNARLLAGLQQRDAAEVHDIYAAYPDGNIRVADEQRLANAHEGRYRRSLEDVLVPFELLPRHSGMHYLPPFSMTAAREVTDEELDVQAGAYCDYVTSARPVFEFDGKDDSRAKTVYPVHYYPNVPTLETRRDA